MSQSGISLADDAAVALFAVDAGGAVRAWSRGAATLFGYTAEEAIGRTLAALIVPEGHADARVDVLRDTATGEVLVSETLRRRKDGELLHVNVSMRALRGTDGRLEGYVHGETDVTHQKVHRDAQLIQARHGALLESTPDAIVIVNDVGRIVLVNGQTETMFGRSREALIGEPLEVLLPQRYRTGHVRHRSQYLAQSRKRPMGAGLELHGLRKDGTEFPVEISLSPLDTEVGRLGMSAIRDISDRRRFEQALHDKNVELERANQAKDKFLATMSHELRTPLNAIIGFTGLILMKVPGPLTADQERQLGLVQSSAKHLLSLINDLLDLAKIDSGHVQMQCVPLACNPVVEEVATTLRPAAEAKGLRLELELPSREVVLLTDRRALQQILLNLAGNAVKFTEQGLVTLALTTLEQPGRAPDVLITVSDTGVGISRADQSRLFKAFTQVGQAAVRRNGEGTGLGLHLSRKLAELLGGSIEVHSEPGQGSRFTLRLPGAGA